jgi:hypothetical protein
MKKLGAPKENEKLEGESKWRGKERRKRNKLTKKKKKRLEVCEIG